MDLKDNLNNQLCNITEENKEMLVEQYKLYVEMADKISQQRSLTNSFYITINTALLAFVGIKGDAMDMFLYVVAGVGIVLSLLWFFNIRSYSQLNSGKFQIIHQMEELMPFRAYKTEWELLGKGKKLSVYYPVSHIEKWIPIVFLILYLSVVVIKIFKI